MKLQTLSIVIPARDEEACIGETVRMLHKALTKGRITHEILVVDDGSKDSTWKTLESLKKEVAALKTIKSKAPYGFGRAICRGFEAMTGDAVVVVMADQSDDPLDVIRYWGALKSGYECVFGSRFAKGGSAVNYPHLKLIVNRAANLFIRILFRHGLDDTTNAFKAYHRKVIDGIKPILSPHFNITVELPLKAIVRGYSFTVIPVSWCGRKQGLAKMKVKEMGSRYLFICLYVWLEKYFSRGDYLKTN